MLLYPALREMLATLPSAEETELLVLIGKAAAAVHRGEIPAGDATS